MLLSSALHYAAPLRLHDTVGVVHFSRQQCIARLLVDYYGVIYYSVLDDCQMTTASNQRCMGPWFEFLIGLSGSSVGINDDSPLFVLLILLLVAVVVQLAFHCLLAVVSLSDSTA
jgi:hypothetical protein